MSTPSDNPEMPLTATQVETWLTTMNQKRFALYARTKEPHVQAVVFWEAADLLQEAIEEVRAISASLRESSQAVCAKADHLQAHAAKLIERSRRAAEHVAQFAPPSPEQVEKAESQTLEMFKGEQRRGHQ